jgi:adenine-specific DNA methylase
VFSGSGAVAHLFKRMGKRVHANDALACCVETATALVVNGRTRLSEPKIAELFIERPGKRYGDAVASSWSGLYFLDEENRALDVVAQNVHALEDRFERALAWHALFQACLKKRPYALFHRANLALRTRDVARSFGNKTSWDAPLEQHFREALDEAHAALVDDGRTHVATQLDALACPLDADLVYLDPPYVRGDGRGFDYADGYHLLEGLLAYEAIPSGVDAGRKHRPYRGAARTDFTRGPSATSALEALVERVPSGSSIVLSYRSDGVPSAEQLVTMLKKSGRRVASSTSSAHGYALARSDSEELLLVASPWRRG